MFSWRKLIHPGDLRPVVADDGGLRCAGGAAAAFYVGAELGGEALDNIGWAEATFLVSAGSAARS